MASEESEHTRARFEEEKCEFEKQLDNLANVPLGSIPNLYHFPELFRPNCPPKRYVHGIDLLNALTFYNEIVSLHSAVVKCAKSNTAPLEAALNDGADMDMCNQDGFTAFECFAKCERRNNCINDVVRIFFKETHIRKLVGLHVHPQNLRQYQVVLSREDMKYFVEQQLKVDYEQELNQMRDVKLSEGFTLRDVFREDINLTPALAKLAMMIQDITFQHRFPQLGHLVKMRYKQIVDRQKCKSLATDAFRFVTRRKIPANCIVMIIKGLTNYDLANLLIVAFNMCLRDYKRARPMRKMLNRSPFGRSPRKMLPRI